MVQVQSTWFPLIDRNPQKFVPSIYKAKAADFVKATQRVYSSPRAAVAHRAAGGALGRRYHTAADCRESAAAQATMRRGERPPITRPA